MSKCGRFQTCKKSPSPTVLPVRIQCNPVLVLQPCLLYSIPNGLKYILLWEVKCSSLSTANKLASLLSDQMENPYLYSSPELFHSLLVLTSFIIPEDFRYTYVLCMCMFRFPKAELKLLISVAALIKAK